MKDDIITIKPDEEWEKEYEKEKADFIAEYESSSDEAQWEKYYPEGMVDWRAGRRINMNHYIELCEVINEMNREIEALKKN